MPTYDYFQENIKRYTFFKSISYGKVLDISSDKSICFHASQILLDGDATEIWHHDISEPSSIEIRKKDKVNNIEFNLKNDFIPEEQFFDCIITNESIQYEHGIFNKIDNILKVLKDDGILIIITTNKDVTSFLNFRTLYDYPQTEFTSTEFTGILKSRFSDIEVLCQRSINKNEFTQQNVFKFLKFKYKMQKLLKNIILKIDKNQKFYIDFVQPLKAINQKSTNVVHNYEITRFQKEKNPLFLIAVCKKKKI
jgi:SAM-dependent methyltransferase